VSSSIVDLSNGGFVYGTQIDSIGTVCVCEVCGSDVMDDGYAMDDAGGRDVMDDACDACDACDWFDPMDAGGCDVMDDA
jgi:hypothetical protein